MGQILIAKCGCCGYTSRKLAYGGGMINFNTFCGYPVINIDTDEVETENIFDKVNVININDYLIFYDTDSLINTKAVDEGNVFKWGKKTIYCGEVYYCPQCTEYRLEFHSAGHWD